MQRQRRVRLLEQQRLQLRISRLALPRPAAAGAQPEPAETNDVQRPDVAPEGA